MCRVAWVRPADELAVQAALQMPSLRNDNPRWFWQGGATILQFLGASEAPAAHALHSLCALSTLCCDGDTGTLRADTSYAV